jgi:phosphotriesterase-related protein
MALGRETLTGKVQTVLGAVAPEELGIALTHEHCVIDITCLFVEPREATRKKLAYEPLSVGNLGYVRYHLVENRDNLLMIDEVMAGAELKWFKRAGGGTIVDVTNVDLGRDPLALRRISEATGLKIIMGSGYYVKAAQRVVEMEKRTEDDIAEEMARDILVGVKDTHVCSGVIGEIGCSWPLEACERKVLRAAGRAQRETGAPLVIHPGRSEDAPAEIVGILSEVGADLTHTVISHIDRTLFVPENRYRLADYGCFLAYDEWGFEGYYPEALSVTDILNDSQRIAQVMDLISHGYGAQVILSHDICEKCRYRAFGGHGYSHILDNAVPAMRRRGMSERDISELLVENPERFLAFR